MTDFECTCFVVNGERAVAWGDDCWCWYPKPNYTERIVRCKDCKYAEDLTKLYESWFCKKNWRSIEPDGFCAWGEEKVVKE